MTKVILTFVATLVAFATAQAEVATISCKPIYMLNALTMDAVITSSILEDGKETHHVTFTATLKPLGHNVEERVVAVAALEGQVLSGTGQPDGQGNIPHYKKFWANASEGDVRRVQLSFGDYLGITANSFIQASDGQYYQAVCRRTME
ncbi:MAG: hypothetical protein V4736_14010 [Bdellovibrionota bacterium]